MQAKYANPILIFGKATLSQLAAFSVVHDGGQAVRAFVVDDAYLDESAVADVPVIAFSDVRSDFPPATHDFLIPVGYAQINGFRMKRCEALKAMGYRLASFVSPHAYVWSGCQISENVIIYENATVQPYVALGRNVTLRSGVNIGHHSHIGDHCFLASSAVTGGCVTIGERSFIGLGATIIDGVTIAPRCFVGAGAVVVADTEPDGVYIGNPARRLEKSSLEATVSRTSSQESS